MSGRHIPIVSTMHVADSGGYEHLVSLVQSVLDRAVNDYSRVVCGWKISGVIMHARSGLGEMLVIRAERTDPAAVVFPWRMLDDISRRIAQATWRITVIVPDIAAAPPGIDDMYSTMYSSNGA